MLSRKFTNQLSRLASMRLSAVAEEVPAQAEWAASSPNMTREYVAFSFNFGFIGG